MSLRMTALVRTKTGNYRARKFLPYDVRADYAALFGPAHETWFGLPSTISLPDAKARYAEWLAMVETRIKTIRATKRGEGQTLSHQQAHALAGDWYRWFTEPREEEPGNAETWNRAFDAITNEIDRRWPHAVSEADYDIDKLLEDEAIRADIRPIVADWAHTAQFLADRGVVLTSEARNLFLDGVIENYIEALDLLRRRAKGDYSPDTVPRRFPQFVKATSIGPLALFEQWAMEAKPAASTINRWRPVFLAMQANFGNKTITEDAARVWIKGLVTAERAAITVHDIWLSAARRVYAWAREQKLASTNPFKDVKIVVPAKVLHRETLAFTADEASTILAAASAIEVTSTFTGAQRWVPWVCAYSGARAGEITQLRGVDIEKRGEHWVMKLTPEAGTMKSRKPRTVPLHHDLISQGFIEFVNSRGKGPLFYNATDSKGAGDATNPKRPRAVKTRERLAVWVRSLGITDRELRPNHAWRHLFKQIADRAGISERVSDTITGHAPATVGRTYGTPTIEDLARELGKFPRYEV